MALTSPAWSSLITRATPDKPRAARPRRNASHPAPSSELVTSMPRISRHPSALTPVAIRQCTLTVRPPSRTFWVSASIHTKVYGPRSSGRFRKPSTSSSSSAAIADTCDLDRPVTPREAASFSTRRVETPSRYDVATTEASARSARRRCSRNDGKYDPDRSFGMASSIVPARVSHSRRRYPLRELTRSGVTSP